jgi:dynein light chain LC8-type
MDPVKEADDDKEEPNVLVRHVDMSEEMKNAAIEVAKAAKKQGKEEKQVAKIIKLEFDKRYGDTWHCIVGHQFGSYVTHGTPMCLIRRIK